jgi:hypothetical protein
LALLKNIGVIHVSIGGKTVQALSAHVGDQIKRILRLAGHGISIYTVGAGGGDPNPTVLE